MEKLNVKCHKYGKQLKEYPIYYKPEDTGKEIYYCHKCIYKFKEEK